MRGFSCAPAPPGGLAASERGTSNRRHQARFCHCQADLIRRVSAPARRAAAGRFPHYQRVRFRPDGLCSKGSVSMSVSVAVSVPASLAILRPVVVRALGALACVALLTVFAPFAPIPYAGVANAAEEDPLVARV